VKQQPLEPEDYLKAHTVLVDALRHGRDWVEALNSTGLLLTPAQDRRIRLEAMQYLVRQVQSWRPAEFLRRKFNASHPCTPADMYSCVLEFLEEHVRWMEKEK
jgi:hypothetical protein